MKTIIIEQLQLSFEMQNGVAPALRSETSFKQQNWQIRIRQIFRRVIHWHDVPASSPAQISLFSNADFQSAVSQTSSLLNRKTGTLCIAIQAQVSRSHG